MLYSGIKCRLSIDLFPCECSYINWIIEEQNSNREIERATMELQQALSDLSNRYQSSAYMQKIFSSSGFSHDILELITSLRFNSQQPQGQYDHPEFKNYFGDFHKPMSEFEPAGEGLDEP